MVDTETLMEVNRELMALRRAQLIINSSPTASMADKRRITERVMELMSASGLVESNPEEAASVMF